MTLNTFKTLFCITGALCLSSSLAYADTAAPADSSSVPATTATAAPDVDADSTYDIFIPPNLKEVMQKNQNAPKAQTAYGVVGTSVSSPNAYGNEGASLFYGLSATNHWLGSTGEDGTMSFGAAYGQPHKYFGASVGVANSSMGIRTRFFTNGNINIRINRYLAREFAVAVGESNLYGWNAYRPMAHSYYGVATDTVQTPYMPISFSAGAGTGSFNSISDGQNGIDDDVYPFAAIGLGLFKNFALIGDWTTRIFSAGVSYSPEIITGLPIGFTLSALNLGGARDSTSLTFVGGVSASYTFA